MSLSVIDWSKLDLSKASVVKREVDVALQRLTDAASNPDINKNKLCNSIQSRIQELENFYVKNSDDERSILFEKERLRLRKALQSLSRDHNSRDAHSRDGRDNRSVNTASDGGGAGGSGAALSNPSSLSGGQHSRLSHGNNYSGQPSDPSVASSHGAASSLVPSLAPSQSLVIGATNAANTSNRSPNTNPGFQNNNRVFDQNAGNPGAALSGLTRLPRSPGADSAGGPSGAIYAWEEGNLKAERSMITVDGCTFIPTTANGMYSRITALPDFMQQQQQQLGMDEYDVHAAAIDAGEVTEMQPDSDKCVDFQIILTQEELTTLAARRKAERSDVKLVKSKMAAKSVHSATPYIEQRRIVKEMYRPENPDKWVNPAGMRAYKRNDGI